MQLKILHWAHVAPNRLSKYRKDVSHFVLNVRQELIILLTVSGVVWSVLRYKSIREMTYLKY